MDISKMKEIDRFIEEKKVKRISPDKELANSLLKNVAERERSILKLKIKDFHLLVFENMYGCLREILDAILALEGYKSYSHEAPIIYLKNFDFPENKIFELNRFRKKRNNSKYYGKSPSLKDAQEIKIFYLENKKILFGIIQKIQNES